MARTLSVAILVVSILTAALVLGKLLKGAFDVWSTSPRRPTFLARAFRIAPKLSATLIMLVLAAVWLGPIGLIVMTSIKSNSAFLAGPFALPTSPNLRALRVGLEKHELQLSARATACSMPRRARRSRCWLALVPAFGLSRMEIPGRKLIFALLLTGLMLPQQTV